MRDPLPPHCKLLLTLNKLSFSSCCCYYLIGSNVRWVFMLSSARLHNGFVNSHFCWTLASVSLAFPKRVILAITNLDSNLVTFHQQLLWEIDLIGSWSGGSWAHGSWFHGSWSRGHEPYTSISFSHSLTCDTVPYKNIFLSFCPLWLQIDLHMQRLTALDFHTYMNASLIKHINTSVVCYKNIPYSGKFSRGINFRDFRDQRPARENLFPRKFIPPKIFCWRAEDPEQSVFEPQIQ